MANEVQKLKDELAELKNNLQKFFDSREFQSGTGTEWRKLTAKPVEDISRPVKEPEPTVFDIALGREAK